MIPAVVLATTLLISPGLQSAPLDERVYVLSQDDRWGAYLSAPDQTAPNGRTAWSWSVWLTLDSSLLIDAFLRHASLMLPLTEEGDPISTLQRHAAG